MTDTQDNKAELAAIHAKRKAEGRRYRESRRIISSRKADDRLLTATKDLKPLLDYKNSLRDQLQEAADDVDNMLFEYVGRGIDDADYYFGKMKAWSSLVLEGRAMGGYARIVPTDQLGYSNDREWVDEGGQAIE